MKREGFTHIKNDEYKCDKYGITVYFMNIDMTLIWLNLDEYLRLLKKIGIIDIIVNNTNTKCVKTKKNNKKNENNKKYYKMNKELIAIKKRQYYIRKNPNCKRKDTDLDEWW